MDAPTPKSKTPPQLPVTPPAQKHIEHLPAPPRGESPGGGGDSASSVGKARPLPAPLPTSIISADIAKQYTVYDEVGKGAYAKVYRAVPKTRNDNVLMPQFVALKILNKEKGARGLDGAKREAELLSTLSHRNVIHVYDTVDNEQQFCIVMELLEGGDLFQRILALKHYSEVTAMHIVHNLLRAVQYLHEHDIVHRDIKPDNVLLSSETDEVTDIRLSDFGFATVSHEEDMTQPCGTPYYLAPEVLLTGVYKKRAAYGRSCDVWSVGVVAYLLLAGYPPFRGSDKHRLFKRILEGGVDLEGHQVWTTVSDDCKAFLRRILVNNPDDRPTASQALDDPWFSSAYLSNEHLTESMELLSEFNARRKVKGAFYGAHAVFTMIYQAECNGAKIRSNTPLADKLDNMIGDVEEIDLENNYLGPKGLEALVRAVAQTPSVRSMNLRNNIIDDEQILKIMAEMSEAGSCTHLTTLNLSCNPITAIGGRAVLSFAIKNKNLVHVDVEDTKVSKNIKRRIAEAVKRNEETMVMEKLMMQARRPTATPSEAPFPTEIPSGTAGTTTSSGRSGQTTTPPPV